MFKPSTAFGLMVVLIIVAISYLMYVPSSSGGGGGGGGGCSTIADCPPGQSCTDGVCTRDGGTSCNKWKIFAPDLTKDKGVLPSWAARAPGCEASDCTLAPAVAIDDQGTTCIGGTDTGNDNWGTTFGDDCEVTGSNLSELYLINRNLMCGPIRTTTDPAQSFKSGSTPLCIATGLTQGILTRYGEHGCPPLKRWGTEWALVADDKVPITH